MASTSHTASPQIKHDVFINFRGKDTRKKFTSHLSAALERNGIDVFTDKGLRVGEEISDTLSNKISESHVSVVIFSENYADSRWCLDELVKIIQCNKDNGQAVLPVFLGVEPTHVRNQTGALGDCFCRLIKKERYRDKEKIWRRALVKTAGLSGLDSSHMSENEIIEKLLECIQNILGKMSSNDFDGNFVGSGRVEKVESWLSSPKLNSVGIWGMGGSGKTTLAKKVFDRISNQFESVCFIENVSDGADKYGTNHLRKHMLSQLLGKGNINRGPPIFSGWIRRKLGRKRVLIVLDDVSNSEQLEGIIGDCGLYCPDSKIIATSRDKQVLKNWCKRTYNIRKLDDGEALQLLKLHIFKQRQPTADHIGLLEQAIRYTQGLPLALVVLGRNLYDKDIRVWKSELVRLSDNPDMQITKILRTSFDGLDDTEKSIFLDIACLFKGWYQDRVEDILDACEFYGARGIDRLIDKALITILDNKLQMHDLLQQMGQHIAFQESVKDTGTPSRLWRFQDIFEVLTQNKKCRWTKTMSQIEGISLDFSKATADMQLKSRVFKMMTGLRFLRFHNASSMNIRILLPEGLKYLPNELRYLRWDQYPLQSLPVKFVPENLVQLLMVDSHLKQLTSDDTELCLPNLRYIDLSGSKKLTKLPTFKNELKLETLVVPFCQNLKEVPNSIQHLVELKYIVLHGNKSLTRFPECSHLTKLEILSLLGCSKISKLPELPRNLIVLNLSFTAIKELPSSIGCLSQLEDLMLCDCKELESLPSSVGELKRLKGLNLGGCPKLLRLPASFSSLKSLEELIIDGCPFKSLLPYSFTCLSSLTKLICTGYKGDVLLSFARLVSLTTLDLRRSNLKSLPEDIKYLRDLQRVNLSGCKYLTFLPEFPPTLHYLDASSCTSLVKYTQTSFRKDHLRKTSDLLGLELEFNFNNCPNLENDARNQIMSDFWLRIQFILVSNVDYWIRITNSSGTDRKRLSAGLCISIGEVPEWFNHYEIGSSLQLKTNQKRRLDFHRLAFCVVVALPPNCCSGSFTIRCVCLDGSGAIPVSRYSCKYSGGEEERISLPAEHLFLWYDHFDSFHVYITTEAIFQFYVDFSDHNERRITSGFKIVKCGITPVGKNYPTRSITSIEDDNYQEEEKEEGPSILKRSRKRKHRNMGEQEEEGGPAIQDQKIMRKSEHDIQGNTLRKAIKRKRKMDRNHQLLDS